MKTIIDRIIELVEISEASIRLNPLEDQIRKFILRFFATKGKGPSFEEISKDLNLTSLEKIRKTIRNLHRADALTKQGDLIISAYPFSSIETPHKIIFEDGHEVYALCATDALGIHFMLEKDIKIISKCPACGKELEINVKDSKINSCEPSSIIEFVSLSNTGCCAAENLCPFINFFCSKEHLKEWSGRNPEHSNGEIYSLDEALKHGKIIFAERLK